MNIPSSIWSLLIGIGLTLISLWYGQNHNLMPVQASEEAKLVDSLFNAMMTVSIGLFLFVEGILIFAAIRYRRRAGDDSDGPPVFGNIPLEMLWTALPAIIVLGISIYSFEIYNAMGGFDPHAIHEAPMQQQAMPMPGAAIAATLSDDNQQKSDEAMQDPATGKPPEFAVNITGMQFAWIFTYPDTGVVASELHVPVGRQVFVNMTANDVIHAFWVPEFRLKQDAIPGRQSEFRFTPDRIGEYPLICAELCGPYHGAMNTKVVVETQADFDKWMQEQQEVATAHPNSALVAVNPATQSPSEFLAPHTKNLGIQPEMLKQIHKLHHH